MYTSVYVVWCIYFWVLIWLLVFNSGNLDERVTDRILYDILIQAGRVVDLHIPKDKESEKPKGFAFAEYETEEIADYAVRLFSGLVTLYKRTLKFAVRS
jgi:splicing factor 3B subunit 4